MTELEQEYNYTPLAKPLRITEQHWPEGTVPLVSITCITYNHVNFIRDAIEGFLMQETTFPVEILIHDDASNDGTAEIVREYDARYPQLIKAIYQTENQYSKGNKPGQFLRPLQRGKYIALCEGDDYWTDPRKLEIQVGYLEDHPECVISGHDAFIVDQQGNKVSDSKLPDGHKRDYSAQDLQYGQAWILTMSWVYRNVLPVEPIPERKYVKNGDNFSTSLLGQFGGSKYHVEISPACYRRHPGGIWSMQGSDVKRDDVINSWFWIYRYYKRIGNEPLALHWKKRWQQAAMPTFGSYFMIAELGKRFLKLRGLKAKMRSILGEHRIRLIKERLRMT